MKGKSLAMLLFALGASGASRAVPAADLLGLYVGAAWGESHVRTSKEILGDTGYEVQFNEHHSAWKLDAGIRPLSALGAELDYIDFGNPSATLAVPGLGGISRVDQKAVALFGVAYLPLPLPFLDVFGKLGVARLHTVTTEVSPASFCPTGSPSCGQTAFDMGDSSTHFAYGAGVQGKVGSLSIQAEYERISASGGNPDLFSVGVAWTF